MTEPLRNLPASHEKIPASRPDERPGFSGEGLGETWVSPDCGPNLSVSQAVKCRVSRVSAILVIYRARLTGRHGSRNPLNS